MSISTTILGPTGPFSSSFFAILPTSSSHSLSVTFHFLPHRMDHFDFLPSLRAYTSSRWSSMKHGDTPHPVLVKFVGALFIANVELPAATLSRRRKALEHTVNVPAERCTSLSGDFSLKHVWG